ncbi:MAG: DUF3127 domain-containing protein [Granulosicoccus sp.]
MGYKAEGKLHKIFDTEQKSGTFQAREFVIEVADGQYPQMVKFQLVQDKCTLIDDYSEGDQIVVEFDLRGREWNEKYFTNLQAWKIARADGSEAEASGGEGQGAVAPASAVTADFDDDIPF